MELIMESNQLELENYQKAKKRVKELKGFYTHLASFVLVISFLAFINLRFSPKHIWFYWPIIGWGIGLLFHGIAIFNFLPFFGKEWEEKKIKELIEKEKKSEWQ